MAALSEIGKYKLLAELFVLAMKLDPNITVAKNNIAIKCLMEFGLNERQAESFLDQAFQRLSQGVMRSPDELLDALVISFRKREHAFILTKVQAILETGEISEKIQEFFDLCSQYLYHED